MKTFGNILWVIFGGLEMAIITLALGLVMCCTIVGIPVGIQMFKIAGFVIWPFGKTVERVSVTGFKIFANVFWAILFGWELSLICFVIGTIFCITGIGIPFGKQWYKLGTFIFLPLGNAFVLKK